MQCLDFIDLRILMFFCVIKCLPLKYPFKYFKTVTRFLYTFSLKTFKYQTIVLKLDCPEI